MTAVLENRNSIGLEKSDYKGLPSTLCPGCGHDSISARIIDAAYQLGIKPHEVIKLSGIAIQRRGSRLYCRTRQRSGH